MASNKKAFITGYSGSSGPYLARNLLNNGYEVYGMVRQNSQNNLAFTKEFNLEDVKIVSGDILDIASINKLLYKIQPDEFYNLAAITNPGISFEQPELTLQTNGMAVLHILESIRNVSPHTKLCQVSTSEIFSGDTSTKKTETTPINPTSPYGASKAYADNMIKIYKQAYGIYGSSMICFNHESPRRSPNSVVRKIIEYVKTYSNSGRPMLPLSLGNLNISRDWGDVPSFVDAMRLSLQLKEPENFVLGNGCVYSLRDLCIIAFNCIGVDIKFISDEFGEFALDQLGNKVIVSDACCFRPNDPITKYSADTTKVKSVLGWQNKLNLEQIVKWMITNVYPTN